MKQCALALLLLCALSACGKKEDIERTRTTYPPSVTEYREGLVVKAWSTAGLSRYRDTEAGVVCYESNVGLSCVPEADTRFSKGK